MRPGLAATILIAANLLGCSGSSNNSESADDEIFTLEFGIKIFRFRWTDFPGATYYRILENPDGLSGFTPISGDIAPGVEVFEHRVALYRRSNARYILQKCDTGGCADWASLDITGYLAAAIGYVKADNPSEEDFFGEHVSLSDDGTLLAVGAAREDSSTSGINSTPDDLSLDTGAVYIFRENLGSWSQEAFIKAGISWSPMGFGRSVSLSGDGNTLAVGTQWDVGGFVAGVFIFRHDGIKWTQEAFVQSPIAEFLDEFSHSISLSNDGNTLAVGAYREDSATTGIDSIPDEMATDSGAAYVFARSAGIWTQQAYIKAGNTGGDDWFGYSVSLSGDGDTLAVGAINEDSATNGIDSTADEKATDSGAVYLFRRSGTAWSQQSYIKAGNTGSEDRFGWSVGLDGDGSTLVVGAFGEDSASSGIDSAGDELADDAGAAYVFARVGGNWSQQAYIKSDNTAKSYFLGYSVSLSEDGDTLAVGSSQESGSKGGINASPDDNMGLAGAAYIFSRDAGIWSQQAYVKAKNPDFGDTFGRSISISGDGETLAAGADWEDSSNAGINGKPNESAPESGAVYLY